VSLVPRLCLTAALSGPVATQNCFDNSLRFTTFSTVMAANDPDRGSQYPGYVLFQQNTTRVCQNFITPQCLADHSDDEEVCMAMLVAAVSDLGGPLSRRGGSGVPRGLTPAGAAGVAVGASVALLALLLAVLLRRRLRRCCCSAGRRRGGRGKGDAWLDRRVACGWRAPRAARGLPHTDTVPPALSVAAAH
jgi:hypothetical protein